MSGSSLICHQPPPQSILCRLVMVIWRPKTSWFPPLDGCIWLILPPSSQLTSNMYVWHVPGDPVMFWSEADKFHFCMFVVYLYDLMFFCFSFYRFFFVSDCSSECLCESFFFVSPRTILQISVSILTPLSSIIVVHYGLCFEPSEFTHREDNVCNKVWKFCGQSVC